MARKVLRPVGQRLWVACRSFSEGGLTLFAAIANARARGTGPKARGHLNSNCYLEFRHSSLFVMIIHQLKSWAYFELCRRISYKERARLSIGVRIGKVWFSSKEAIAFRPHLRIGWHGGMELGGRHRFGSPS